MPPILTERADLYLKGVERIKKKTLPKMLGESLKKFPHWKEEVPLFHANQAGACWRKLCYQLLGVDPTPMELGGAQRVYDGEAHANSIIHWLGEMGLEVFGQERSFCKKVKINGQVFWVSGHVDGLIVFPARSGKMLEGVFEAKGLSTWTATKADPLDVVNKGYRLQVQDYMWLSGRRHTLLVVKNKNSSDLRFFQIDYSRTTVTQTMRRRAKVVKAVRAKKLLPREYEKNSYECMHFCPFYKKCWKET